MAFAPFVPLDNNISDPGDLISAEIFKTLAENCNYLIDSMPVGSIVPILVGLTGVPTPDPRLWQLCDGSVITDQNSPLRNNTTPDYTASDGTYIKCSTSLGVVGSFGGANSKNLSHNHGGSTQSAGLDEDNADEEFPDWYTVKTHVHTVPSDLTTTNFEPVHIRVNHYIKIF